MGTTLLSLLFRWDNNSIVFHAKKNSIYFRWGRQLYSMFSLETTTLFNVQMGDNKLNLLFRWGNIAIFNVQMGTTTLFTVQMGDNSSI